MFDENELNWGEDDREHDGNTDSIDELFGLKGDDE